VLSKKKVIVEQNYEELVLNSFQKEDDDENFMGRAERNSIMI